MNSNTKTIVILFSLLIVMLICMQSYCSIADFCEKKKQSKENYFTGGYGPNDSYHTPGFYTPPYWTGDYYGQDGYTNDNMFCDRTDAQIKRYPTPTQCVRRGQLRAPHMPTTDMMD